MTGPKPSPASTRIYGKWIEDGSGCWLWTASNTNGYGVIFHYGRYAKAHRVVYETLIGPIPAGLQLDHLCRVTLCVNPKHLEPVTMQENIRRGSGNGSALWAPPTHCAKGHELTADNVYVTAAGKRLCKACKHGRDKAYRQTDSYRVYQREWQKEKRRQLRESKGHTSGNGERLQ
jgi:hypothetical protein